MSNNGYPVYKDQYGHEHTIIGWAIGFPRCNWEWFATEKDKECEGIYFGYVMGFEDEWGSFSVDELKENGIRFITNPRELQGLMPPPGWTKV